MNWDLIYGMRNVNKDASHIGKELFISNFIAEIPKQPELAL
ncbi:MAG: hypothetical protein R2880_07560 [Deinococcales bacterium]